MARISRQVINTNLCQFSIKFILTIVGNGYTCVNSVINVVWKCHLINLWNEEHHIFVKLLSAEGSKLKIEGQNVRLYVLSTNYFMILLGVMVIISTQKIVILK